MSGGRNRFPFTAAQWQELEHQALIFKYMVSGIPIPPDLLFTIKKTSLDSPFISNLFPHQYPDQVGWSCLQMGGGRKIDAEPGRCRRTDGKKWRCSKEAYPDSKYCERHMHRGKNRSRKPVEVLKTTSAATTTTATSTALNSNFPSTAPISSYETHPFLYQHSSSSAHLDSVSYSHNNSDYRYIYGVKEDVDEEHPFASDNSWELTPLTMSCSSSSSRQKDCSSYLQLQSFGDSPIKQEQQHYYEIMQSNNMEIRDQPQKIMHHFFDEFSPKHKQSWLHLVDHNSSNTSSLSATHLSMSVHDFSSFFTSNTNKS